MGQTQTKVEGPAPVQPEKATEAPSTACVFILGRQHSGNTVLAHLLGRLPGVYARVDENGFMEHRARIDRLTSPTARALAVIEALRLEEGEDQQGVRGRLLAMAASEPNVTALSLYLAGMDVLAAGAHTWVQKATSYIFHVNEILSDLPSSRLVYILRNPFDLAASEKRREWTRGYVWGTPKGWSVGLALAMRAQTSRPDRFRIVTYEDMVREPERTARDLCKFLGLTFDPRCLDVPRVNPSEAGAYSLKEEAGARGLSSGKVYGYVNSLTPVEIAAVEMMARGGALDRYYADRPTAGHRASLMLRARARVMLLVAAVRFGWTYATKLDRSPGHLVRRTLRRLRGG